MFNGFSSLFHNGDVKFLTVRNPDLKDINSLDRQIKRFSSRYIIVRELDNDKVNCHYHAIVRLDRAIPLSFFKKGRHYNVRHIVGNLKFKPAYTSRDIYDFKFDFPDILLLKAIDDHFRLQTKLNEQIRRRYHVRNVLVYMSKDNPLCCFKDYIVVKSNHYIQNVQKTQKMKNEKTKI